MTEFSFFWVHLSYRTDLRTGKQVRRPRACSTLTHRLWNRFTCRDSMTALWSEIKATLAEQRASIIYLFQWKVSRLFGVEGNVTDAWHFPRLCMPTVRVCVYVGGNPSMETDVVLPRLFFCGCLCNFSSLHLFSLFGSFSSQRSARLAVLSGWMVFCAAKAISQGFFFLHCVPQGYTETDMRD